MNGRDDHVAEWIRARRGEIVAAWRGAASAALAGRASDEGVVPELLERLNDDGQAKEAAQRHALARLHRGFELSEVILELQLLRDTILDAHEHAQTPPGLAEVHALVRALDRAIAAAAEQYTSVHERDLQALADNIPQLAWIADGHGAMVWFNRRWFEYTGEGHDGCCGDGWLSLHHPDHRERVRDGFRVAVATGEVWEDTVPLRGRDGHDRWFLARAMPIHDERGHVERWFGTYTDVTGARFLDEATAVLSRELGYHETLQTIARLAVPDLADWCILDLMEGGELRHVAVAHADPTKLEHAREFARRYPPLRSGSRGVPRVIASGQPAFVPEVTEDMLFAISRDELEARELRELGIRSWIAAPLVARGKTLGAVSMIMSGCRRYRQSDVLVAMELGRRAGIAVDNARLYREAKDAVRVRDGVLATVSHDLRSPLGAIELATTLLVQSCGAQPGARGQIEAVRRSVDRMARLIDDLLDMASIDAGRLKLRASQEDARSVLEDVVESFAARASERRIELACECEQAQLPVVCDRSRIARVFENIIGNALKFCRAGERVVVHAARDGERIRVVVRDTGPGIRREDLPHIFEPYWSARDGTQRRGVGLGLFISKGIVEAHSGELAVDSEEGRGTTFTVTLPVAGPATTAR